jgi:glycerol-3-phosphate cytidylyltransferase-like family protein
VINGKGKVPIHDELYRKKNVETQFPHARVILGDEKDIFAPIRMYQPDILAFGYDQKVPEEKLQALFPDVEFLRISSHDPHIWKSSLLRENL